MFTPRGTAGAASATMAKSSPGSRRRRVSQPSYTLPRMPNAAGSWPGGPGSIRLCASAKNSSLAYRTEPPSTRLATSGRPPNGAPWSATGHPRADQLAAPLARPDRRPGQPGLPDHPAQPLAQVRGDRVALAEHAGVQHEALVRREHAEVGALAGRDRAPAGQPGQPGRGGRQPAGHLVQPDAPAGGLGPQHRQAELD